MKLNLRKTLSLLLAGAIMVTSLLCGTITASADSTKSAVTTIKVSDISPELYRVSDYLGKDLYVMTEKSNTIQTRHLYLIDDKAIESFKATGKLNAKEIKVDASFSKYEWSRSSNFGFGNSECINISYLDDNNNYVKITAKYDEKNKKLVKVCECSSSNAYVTTDGYTVDIPKLVRNQKEFTVNIYDSDGKRVKSLKRTVNILNTNKAYWYSLANTISFTTEQIFIYGQTDLNKSKLISVDMNNKETEYKTNNNSMPYEAGINYILLWNKPSGSSEWKKAVLLTESQKLYALQNTSTVSFENEKYYLSGLYSQVAGTLAGAIYGNEDGTRYKYVILDIEKDKIISNAYDYIILSYFFEHNNEQEDEKSEAALEYYTGYYYKYNNDGSREPQYAETIKIQGNKKIAEHTHIANISTSFSDGEDTINLVNDNGKIYFIDQTGSKISEELKTEGDSTKLFVHEIGKLFTYGYSEVDYLSAKTKNTDIADTIAVIDDIKKISNLKIEAISDRTYSGKAIKPAVTVKDGNYTLVKGTDYKLSYKDNTEIGKASVTIKGIGKYSGTVTKTFKIIPRTPGLSGKKSSGKITLKWADISEAEKYMIYYSLDGETFKKYKTLEAGTTSYTLNYTKKNSVYFKIRSYKAVDGKSYYSNYSKVIEVK